jgi:hypothetical protein
MERICLLQGCQSQRLVQMESQVSAPQATREHLKQDGQIGRLPLQLMVRDVRTPDLMGMIDH